MLTTLFDAVFSKHDFDLVKVIKRERLRFLLNMFEGNISGCFIICTIMLCVTNFPLVMWSLFLTLVLQFSDYFKKDWDLVYGIIVKCVCLSGKCNLTLTLFSWIIDQCSNCYKVCFWETLNSHVVYVMIIDYIFNL